MAYIPVTIKKYAGDGVTTTWVIGFTYQNKSEVKAYTIAEDGTRVDIVVTPANFLSDNILEIAPAVPIGLTLVIHRETAVLAPVVDWQRGSLLTADNLDKNDTQAVQGIQELRDQFYGAIDSGITQAGKITYNSTVANGSFNGNDVPSVTYVNTLIANSGGGGGGGGGGITNPVSIKLTYLSAIGSGSFDSFDIPSKSHVQSLITNANSFVGPFITKMAYTTSIANGSFSDNELPSKKHVNDLIAAASGGSGIITNAVLKTGLQEMDAGSNLGVSSLTGRSGATNLSLDVVPSDRLLIGSSGTPNVGPKLRLSAIVGDQPNAAFRIYSQVGDAVIAAGVNTFTIAPNSSYNIARSGTLTQIDYAVAGASAVKRYDFASDPTYSTYRVYSAAAQGTPVIAYRVNLGNTGTGSIGVNASPIANSRMYVSANGGTEATALTTRGAVTLEPILSETFPTLNFSTGATSWSMQSALGDLYFLNGAGSPSAVLSQNGNLQISGNLITDNGTFGEAFSVVPTIVGSTSAGTATYTVQAAEFTRVGANVLLRIQIAWSGHTGTGNLRIAGAFPSGNVAAAEIPDKSVMQGYFLSAANLNTLHVFEIDRTVVSGTQVLVKQRNITTDTTFTDMPLPASGSLVITGYYRSFIA